MIYRLYLIEARVSRFKNRLTLNLRLILKIGFQKSLRRVVYKYRCGICRESYYGECVRHLNVKTVVKIFCCEEKSLISLKSLLKFLGSFNIEPVLVE